MHAYNVYRLSNSQRNNFVLLDGRTTETGSDLVDVWILCYFVIFFCSPLLSRHSTAPTLKFIIYIIKTNFFFFSLLEMSFQTVCICRQSRSLHELISISKRANVWIWCKWCNDPSRMSRQQNGRRIHCCAHWTRSWSRLISRLRRTHDKLCISSWTMPHCMNFMNFYTFYCHFSTDSLATLADVGRRRRFKVLRLWLIVELEWKKSRAMFVRRARRVRKGEVLVEGFNIRTNVVDAVSCC